MQESKIKLKSTYRQIVLKMIIKLKFLFNKFFNNITLVSKEDWDFQYKKGVWSGLRCHKQLAPYSIIIGYLHTFKKGGSILDVGCGEGIIHEYLCQNSYKKYIGIDISSEAIKLASRKENDKTFFIEEDLTKFNTSEKFDTIIFNEVLYYLRDINLLDLMKKYDRFLKKDGVYIIGMYKKEGIHNLWRLLESAYPIIDKTIVANINGRAWVIEVFQPSMRLISDVPDKNYIITKN